MALPLMNHIDNYLISMYLETDMFSINCANSFFFYSYVNRQNSEKKVHGHYNTMT